MPRRTRRAIVARARAWLAEGRAMVRANLGLSPSERETMVLVCALFALGLAIQLLRQVFRE